MTQSRSTALVKVEGVVKTFGQGAQEVDALRGVSFELGTGQLIGLLGNNGAGKTTLMRIIAGLVDPTEGEVWLSGLSLSQNRRLLQRDIGLCSAEDRAFYPRLSGRENLRFFGKLYGLEKERLEEGIEHYASLLKLDRILSRPFQTYSSGQRQRLNLVRGMLHEPTILLLDEATRSVDAATVDLVKKVLLEYAHEKNRLVLYAGHEFQGLEEQCDAIVVLDEGQVVLAGRGSDVLRQFVSPAWQLRFRSSAGRDQALERWPELLSGEQPIEALWPIDADHVSIPLTEIERDTNGDLLGLERRERLSVREFLVHLSKENRSVTQHAASIVLGCGASETAKGHKPQPTSTSLLAAVFAIVRRDRLIFLSFRFRLALQTGTLLVWAALFYFLSGFIENSSELNAKHFPQGYLTFALFGFIALQIGNLCLTQIGSALRDEQLQGTVEPLIATGRPPILLVSCSLIWPLCIALFNGVVILFGGVFLGAELDHVQWPGVILACALMSLALAGWGILSAAFTIAFKRGDPVSATLGILTLLLSGAYFPVEVLPLWLARIAQLVPLNHGLQAARAATDGKGLMSAEFLEPVGALTLLTLFILPVGIAAFAYGLRYARKAGGLCHS